MHTFLGLLGVAVFIPIVIGLAAGMTLLVVRLSPPADGSSASKQSPRSS